MANDGSFSLNKLSGDNKTPSVTTTRQWFRDKALNTQTVNTTKLVRENTALAVPYITQNSIGSMFMFFYDPKAKKQLPYYDRFPLIFPFSEDAQSFKALNMHYINPNLRAKLMDAFYTILNNDKHDETTKVNLSYKLLKSASKFRYYKPCIKQYLKDHVKSRFIQIPIKEWDLALFLPTERFVKATKYQVWKDSDAMLRGK